MLLERDDAMRLVTTAARDAASGRGGTVLVEGAAGLGKSALLRTLRARATGLGLDVLTGLGGELEQALPWGVARELLRRPLAAVGASPDPLVTAVLGLGGAVPDDDLAPLQPLTEALVGLAADRPLLVVVDDAHWCDPASARWLSYLAPRLTDQPVLVVVATRPDDPARPDGLTALAARDGVRRLPLVPLSDRAVAALVRSAVPGADDALCAACSRATAGNHFLTVELIRELEAGAEPAPGVVERLAVASVDRAVRRRLQAVGPVATVLAEAVAVFGADASVHDAAAVAGVAPDEARRAADALRAAGLLTDPAPGRVALSHPLLRTAVEAAVPAGRRSATHLAAARHLDAHGAAVDTVGAHLLRVDPGDDPWVRARLVAAADAAREAGAPAVAVALLRRAADERLGPPDRQLLVALGRAALAVDPPAAIAPLTAAYEATEDPGERARLAVALAVALQGARRFADIWPLLAPLGDELAEVPALRGAWWRVEAELLAQAAMQPDLLGPRRDRLRRLAPLLSGEHREEALVLVQLAVDEVQGGRAASARRLVERAWSVDEPQRLAPLASPVGAWALFVLMYADAAGSAARVAGAWVRDAQQRGGGAEVAYAYAALSEAQWRTGALREAEASAVAGLALADEVGPGFVAWWQLTGCLAQALLAAGRADEARHVLAARHLLDGPAPLVWLMPTPGVVRASVLLATGDAERGLAELEQVDAWLAALPGAASSGAWRYRADLAEALVRAGRPDDARRLVERWDDVTGGFGSPVVDGMVRRTRGLVERRPELLAEAVDLLAPTEARTEHARALLEHGAALRRADRRVDARAPLRTALDLAHACGAGGLAARAREELRASGARPRREAVSGPEALTPSELRVGQLAAEGLSNPAIAATLYVTRKTVEKHLAGAYAKLGVVRRQDLAVALAGGSA